MRGRVIVAFRNWGYIILLITCLLYLFRLDTRPGRYLSFTSTNIEVGPKLPGKVVLMAYLHNSGNQPVTNIILKTSCFCTEIDDSDRISVIQPDQTVPIHFHVNATQIGTQLASIIAITKKETITLPILIHVVSPLLDSPATLSLGNFARKAPGYETTPKYIKLKFRKDVNTININPASPWLHIITGKIRNGTCILRVFASADAPENNATVAATVRFTAHSQSEQIVIPLSVYIKSSVKVLPSDVFFGVLQRKMLPISKRVTISANHLVCRDIKVLSDNDDVTIQLLAVQPNCLVLGIKLRSGHIGNISGYIRIKYRQTILAVIPYSAFIQ